MFTIRNIVRGARTIFTSPTGGELISSTAQLMPCLNSLQPGYEMCPGRSWGKKTHLQAGEHPVGEVVQLWASTAGFSRQRNTEDQGNGFLWGSEDIHRAHNKGSCLQLGSGGRASNPAGDEQMSPACLPPHPVAQKSPRGWAVTPAGLSQQVCGHKKATREGLISPRDSPASRMGSDPAGNCQGS